MIEQVGYDPRVSCCIVAGEYMRATGFFYRGNQQTYLVTARHNVLPTDVKIPNPVTNGYIYKISTDDNYEVIDIYLRGSGKTEHQRVDLVGLDEDEIISDPTADVLAVPIEFDPEEWGYTVFNKENITVLSEESHSVTTYGFLPPSLPDKGQYDISYYRENIGPPCELTVGLSENTSEAAKNMENVHGVMLLPEPAEVGKFNGLSGTPWLGDGLLGIHSGTTGIPASRLGGPDHEEWRRLHYYSPKILEHIVG